MFQAMADNGWPLPVTSLVQVMPSLERMACPSAVTAMANGVAVGRVGMEPETRPVILEAMPVEPRVQVRPSVEVSTVPLLPVAMNIGVASVPAQTTLFKAGTPTWVTLVQFEASVEVMIAPLVPTATQRLPAGLPATASKFSVVFVAAATVQAVPLGEVITLPALPTAQ